MSRLTRKRLGLGIRTLTKHKNWNVHGNEVKKNQKQTKTNDETNEGGETKKEEAQETEYERGNTEGIKQIRIRVTICTKDAIEKHAKDLLSQR